MSDPTAPEGQQFFGPITPLAVRMPEELRTHLDILAQLNGRSTTEECRVALEAWVLAAKSDPNVTARAQQVADEIEREANAKRAAITSILGPTKGSSTSKSMSRSAGPTSKLSTDE
jgi:plasmid stability protein